MKILQKLHLLLPRDRIKELEEKITDLDKRVFKKKEIKETMSGLTQSFYYSFMRSDIDYEPKPLEEEVMELQDKLEALEKHLKVKIELVGEKDSYYKVVPVKKTK